MAIDKNKIAAPVAITDPYNLLGIYPASGQLPNYGKRCGKRSCHCRARQF